MFWSRPGSKSTSQPKLLSSQGQGSASDLQLLTGDSNYEQHPLITSSRQHTSHHSTEQVVDTFASSSESHHLAETFELASLDGDASPVSSRNTSLDLQESRQFLSHNSSRKKFKMTENAYSSKLRYWANKIAVENDPGLPNKQLMLINYDLKPVEPERRQWGAWNFVGFWIADSFNINTWMISSSMITGYGLSWWQSWICVWLGYTIAALFVCATGRIGSTYHIGFPVVARSSFGIWGCLWPVFNRAAMACIWYGVQAWIGGECVKLMITAIWPQYNNLHNSLPKSAGIETKDYVAFFLFWAGSLPAIWFPVHKIRHLFTVKAYFVPTAGIAFFIWAIVKAHGIGPIVHQPGKAHGSSLGWGMVQGVMSSIANFATLIVNDPDFARFAKKPKDAFWSQLITIPVGFAFTSFVGIIVSSSSSVIYGEAIWNPLDLLTRFLEDANSGTRFGVFIISLAFTLAQLGTNIAANSVSAGTDMTALLPRYINIRRGGYICAVVGLAMCPWNLLSSSNQFLTYLSSYSVFLSSIAGVICSDYYIVRKGYLQVKDLYSGRNTGPYYFTYGINWRAYAAYIAGILINIIGFAGAVGVKVPQGATYIYDLNFFGGFIVASVSYYLLCRFFPIPACADSWLEVGDEFHNMSVADYDDEVVVSPDLEQGGEKKADARSILKKTGTKPS